DPLVTGVQTCALPISITSRLETVCANDGVVTGCKLTYSSKHRSRTDNKVKCQELFQGNRVELMTQGRMAHQSFELRCDGIATLEIGRASCREGVENQR